jgi:Rieske Fe-S protein
MPHHTPKGSEVTRRAVVAGAGVLAVSATLAACSSYGRSAGSAPEASADQPAALGGQALGSTSDIPVGGGAVFESQKVVVTQPTPGNFKAFSAICTHAGCTVNKVASGTINCPCHGSKYAIADGSVVNGPAKKPLAERQIMVSGNTIQLA